MSVALAIIQTVWPAAAVGGAGYSYYRFMDWRDRRRTVARWDAFVARLDREDEEHRAEMERRYGRRSS